MAEEITIQINPVSDYLPYERTKIDLRNFKKAVAQNPQPPVPMTNIDNIGAYSGAEPQLLYNLFSNIDKMSEEELEMEIIKTLDGLLQYASPNATQEQIGVIWSLFNNVKYLMGLNAVLGRTKPSQLAITSCNNIIYNYMVTKKKDKNPNARTAIRMLAQTLNAGTINEITSAGFNIDEAADIAVCVYSTATPLIGVKRMNAYLINANNEYTESQMVSLYVNLYGDRFTVLVEGIMFDKYPEDTLRNMDDNAKDTYYLQNLAMLDILEQAPTSAIYNILKNYSFDFYSYAKGENRFRFVVNQEDYPRINQAIVLLANAEHIYVP